MASSAKTPTTMLETLLPTALYAAVNTPQPQFSALEQAHSHLNSILHTLMPFVPATMRFAPRNPDGTAVTPAQYRDGTLLCADMSGFTALTVGMAQIGRQGSEEVSTIVSQIFTRLLDAVQSGGGEAVKFAGNSLIAFFGADQLGDRHAALAAATALAMQETMREFAAVATSQGDFRLGARVTIHSDAVFLAELGDDQHRELIVSGRAMHTVVSALRVTEPGEIVVTPQTAALLKADTTPRDPDLHLLNHLHEQPAAPASPSAEALSGAVTLDSLRGLASLVSALQPYLPFGLAQKGRDLAAVEGGFRPVSVGFARVAAFTNALELLNDTEVSEREIATVYQVLNTSYTHAQTVLAYFGGGINKVDMAMGSDRLMALFGAPMAHEDDPVRAVRALLQLRGALQEIDHDTAILLQTWRDIHTLPRAKTTETELPPMALATGTVFAGIVGNARRYEYTVIGDTINLAGRLFEVARPGELLMPAATYQSVQHIASADPRPPQTLPGFSSPVEAVNVRKVRAVSRTIADTPFVGREPQLAEILEKVQPIIQGLERGGAAVGLVGEAGIGKTRLAEEVIAKLQPPVVIRAVCQSYEQNVPYATISRILPELLYLNPNQDRASQAANLENQLTNLVPAWSRFAPLLGPILNLPIAETSLTRGLSPAQRRERTDEMILRLILAVARRQPTVLLVDTLHWIDASSYSILDRVTLELAQTPLVVLLTYRLVDDLGNAWLNEPHATTFDLEPLTSAESEKLLTMLLGDAPAEELNALIERSAGLPLYLEQTVRYLKESNGLQRDAEGVLRGLSAATLRVPTQIEQLIVARLDQLDKETRSLVQIAAVIGQQFTDRVLAAVVPSSGSRQKRLFDLVAAGILEVEGQPGALDYRFTQTLIRDVAYESLLYSRRQTLHATIAQIIEHLYADDLDDWHVALAQHYQAATQLLPAFTTYLVAAQVAQSRYANQEALALYQRAQQLTAQLREEDQITAEETLRLAESVGDVQTFLGAYDEARSQYQAALDGSAEVDAVIRATLQRKIGTTYEQQGDWDNALTWLATAQATVATAEANPAIQREYAHILSAIGWIHFRQRDLPTAQTHLQQAFDLIKPLGKDDDEAQILNRLGGVFWMQGDMAQARQHVEQSLGASQRSDDLIGQARSLNNLSILASNQDNTSEAIKYALHALDIQERIGSIRDSVMSYINLGLFMHIEGQYKEAAVYFKQAVDKSIQIDDTYHQMKSLSNYGRTLAELGQYDQGRGYLEQSLALCQKLNLDQDQLDIYIGLAELELARNQLERAEAEYRLAAAIEKRPESEEVARLQRLEGRIRLAHNDRKKARKLLVASEELFRKLDKLTDARLTRALIGTI
jgi:class 3 adenylate cyclase/tetratricopeptide (TPR) repeat protein